jgi:hypothetical protein
MKAHKETERDLVPLVGLGPNKYREISYKTSQSFGLWRAVVYGCERAPSRGRRVPAEAVGGSVRSDGSTTSARRGARASSVADAM